MPDKVEQAEKDLEKLLEHYKKISSQIDALREKKRVVTAAMAEKEAIIEEDKRAGWGQVIG